MNAYKFILWFFSSYRPFQHSYAWCVVRCQKAYVFPGFEIILNNWFWNIKHKNNLSEQFLFSIWLHFILPICHVSFLLDCQAVELIEITIILYLQRKSAEADIDALRDEYHQRVAALERKVVITFFPSSFILSVRHCLYLLSSIHSNFSFDGQGHTMWGLIGCIIEHLGFVLKSINSNFHN